MRLQRLRELGVRLTSSLWFVPALLVLLAITFAICMIWLDTIVARDALYRYPRLFGAGPDGSRSMLAAIASSMITVAGVTFSITVVAVAQASNQYTSRILRNFMSDRANQIVLGVFLGIFAYCVVVIRTIRGGEDLRFVPAVSTLAAFLLAIAGIAFLIFFVNHIAGSLQAESLLARVSSETRRSIDQLFPPGVDSAGNAAVQDPPDPPRRQKWVPVRSERTGYIQAVDSQSLLELAEQIDAVIRMERGIGDFVIEEETLAAVAAAEVSDGARRRIARTYQISDYRTVHQDVAFGIRQLVDVALKALSPGVNDTTTAIASIDHLTSVLARVAPRTISAVPRLPAGCRRVLSTGSSFEAFLDTAFDEIRRFGAGNVNVLERMLTALQTFGTFTTDAARRSHLRVHVERISEVAQRSVAAPAERCELERRCATARAALA